MDTTEIGRLGEEYTAQQLRKSGYMILEKNFRCPYGEIDLIARRGEFLAFVEVKTRSHRALDRPGAWVTLKKQKKIILTAQSYLLLHPNELQPRFDVAEVVVGSGSSFQVVNYQYIKGAFFVDESD